MAPQPQRFGNPASHVGPAHHRLLRTYGDCAPTMLQLTMARPQMRGRRSPTSLRLFIAAQEQLHHPFASLARVERQTSPIWRSIYGHRPILAT
jgi:hypothetical protein